jgi:hypothetical protein
MSIGEPSRKGFRDPAHGVRPCGVDVFPVIPDVNPE